MAKLLCRLSQMPEDERLEICDLLVNADIAYYETHAGFWGVGVAALWLSDALQYDVALELFEEYQQQRYARVTSEAIQEDRLPSSFIAGLGVAFFQRPLMFSLCVLVIMGILAISIYPFML